MKEGQKMAIGKQAKILTDKQQKHVLNYLTMTRYPLRNRLIFLFSFKAGLRAKEIANLKWYMVCDSEGHIATTLKLENKASKGKYSGRVIPLHPDIRQALNDLYQQQAADYFTPQNHIIQTEREKRTTAQVIVNFFHGLYRDLGLEGCSSHSGRRTFITNAAKNIGLAGGTLNDVRLLAGHASLNTTQRYIEYNTDAQKRLVNLI